MSSVTILSVVSLRFDMLIAFLLIVKMLSIFTLRVVMLSDGMMGVC
jgi:hypothetical protein